MLTPFQTNVQSDGDYSKRTRRILELVISKSNAGQDKAMQGLSTTDPSCFTYQLQKTYCKSRHTSPSMTGYILRRRTLVIFW